MKVPAALYMAAKPLPGCHGIIHSVGLFDNISWGILLWKSPVETGPCPEAGKLSFENPRLTTRLAGQPLWKSPVRLRVKSWLAGNILGTIV